MEDITIIQVNSDKNLTQILKKKYKYLKIKVEIIILIKERIQFENNNWIKDVINFI